MGATFEGMTPWESDSDIIECNTPDGTIDLHNEATLVEISLTLSGRPGVHLRFLGDDERQFQLSFESAHAIAFHEDAGSYWPVDIRGVETLYGIDYDDGPDDTPRFEVRTLLGVLTFSA